MGMLEKLQGKIVFFDFDGTLAVYQASEDTVHTPEIEYITTHMDGYNEGKGGVFNTVRPIPRMMELVSKLNPDTTYLISMVATSFEAKNKDIFMGKYYPNIPKDNLIYVGSSKYKRPVIEYLYTKYFSEKYTKSEIVIIEDTIDVIHDLENVGFKCYHISSFL